MTAWYNEEADRGRVVGAGCRTLDGGGGGGGEAAEQGAAVVAAVVCECLHTRAPAYSAHAVVYRVAAAQGAFKCVGALYIHI